jgi:hypothetical protein
VMSWISTLISLVTFRFSICILLQIETPDGGRSALHAVSVSEYR